MHTIIGFTVQVMLILGVTVSPITRQVTVTYTNTPGVNVQVVWTGNTVTVSEL